MARPGVLRYRRTKSRAFLVSPQHSSGPSRSGRSPSGRQRPGPPCLGRARNLALPLSSRRSPGKRPAFLLSLCGCHFTRAAPLGCRPRPPESGRHCRHRQRRGARPCLHAPPAVGRRSLRRHLLPRPPSLGAFCPLRVGHPMARPNRPLSQPCATMDRLAPALQGIARGHPPLDSGA